MKSKNKEKEIVKIEESSPAMMIREAIKTGSNLDQLEKLLALQERFEANEARKAYHEAMAAFKADPPKINKDKTVSFNTSAGKTSYNHATLANVTEKINTALSKHGLSASWSTKQNGAILVTCKITHARGHSEETTLQAPSDTSGSKNAIQAIGSTISYLCRYTLLCLTGLATYEQDDDGKAAGAPVEYIDDKQLHSLRDNMIALKISEKKFVEYLKIESLEKMPKSDYRKALVTIEAKRKSKVANND